MKTKPENFKICLYFLLIAFSFGSKAQTADSVLTKSQLKVNAKIFGVGASYERRLSEHFTLFAETGIRTANGMNLSTYDFAEGWNIYNAELGLEGRYYYNLKKRAQKNKRTTNNSANFWSFSANYGFKPFTGAEDTKEYEAVFEGQVYYVRTAQKYSLFTVAPSWGFQRMIGNKFSLETSLGISLNYIDYGKDWSNGQTWDLAPAIGFHFGYVIN